VKYLGDNRFEFLELNSQLVSIADELEAVMTLQVVPILEKINELP
jgi:hypothetical protein